MVRIATLLHTTRSFQGSLGVSRPPQVGDAGTIVAVYDGSAFCVESVASDGMTVWVADFALEELELL